MEWSRDCALAWARNAAQLAATRDRLVKTLGTRLAEIHDLPREERFWRILLGAWALRYVAELHDRYTLATLIRELYPKSAVTAPYPGQYWTPSDTHEHALALQVDDYRLQAFAAMFGALGAPLRTVEEGVSRPAPQEKICRTGVASAALRTVTRARNGRVVLMKATYFPRYMEWFVALRTLGAALPVPRFAAPRALVDQRLRLRLRGLEVDTAQFEQILAASVVRDLPTVFLEGMPELISTVRRGYPHRASAFFSANGWYSDEPFKLAAALATQRAAKILGTQHGGNYGIDAVHPSEALELSFVDRYFTWGWGRADAAVPISAMPATKFTTRRFKPPMQGDGALFVSTTQDAPNSTAAHARFAHYLAWQQRFACALGPRGQALLRLRLHPNDNGWDMTSRWAEFAPDVRLEARGTPFDASLRRSRVVVCDHLSTTYAQSLVANRPTILFWDRDVTFLRRAAQPTFERLREVGILCDTPERAAETLLEVYADPESWWTDEERRAAVHAFVVGYALTVRGAAGIWSKELRRCAKA